MSKLTAKFPYLSEKITMKKWELYLNIGLAVLGWKIGELIYRILF